MSKGCLYAWSRETSAPLRVRVRPGVLETLFRYVHCSFHRLVRHRVRIVITIGVAIGLGLVLRLEFGFKLRFRFSSEAGAEAYY